jgi:hypothetical protein
MLHTNSWSLETMECVPFPLNIKRAAKPGDAQHLAKEDSEV